MRIVSLVPSGTEIVALLGGARWLVGRSHECDFPPQVRRVPALTSGIAALGSAGLSSSAQVDRAVSAALEQGENLYRLDADRLRELAPDLVITQDVCSVCSIDHASVRAALQACEAPPVVLSLNPASFEDVLDDIVRIGEAMGCGPHASEVVVALRERFFRAADHVNSYTTPVPVLLLEWTDPPFVAGHWGAQLVERAGGVSLLNPTHAMDGAGAGAGGQMAHRVAGPSRRVAPDEIAAANPAAIVVCPCGVTLPQARREYHDLARQAWWRDLRAVRGGYRGGPGVMLVDGTQMFSRPGPRLVDAFEWLVGWLNGVPALLPPGFPAQPAPGLSGADEKGPSTSDGPSKDDDRTSG